MIRALISGILPDEVCGAEAFADTVDGVLFPEEQRAVTGVFPERLRAFTTARMCARRALAGIGVPTAPIPPGAFGAPVWPPGVVGSITHCTGYRAAAVALRARVLSVGIDAEPDAPLPADARAAVVRPEERVRLSALSRVPAGPSWDRVLFSAKESVYKAWFPLTGYPLDFGEASLTIDPHCGTFATRLLVTGPVGRQAAARVGALSFHGNWLAADGLVLTAVVCRPG